VLFTVSKLGGFANLPNAWPHETEKAGVEVRFLPAESRHGLSS
jgi:hypothetical protein